MFLVIIMESSLISGRNLSFFSYKCEINYFTTTTTKVFVGLGTGQSQCERDMIGWLWRKISPSGLLGLSAGPCAALKSYGIEDIGGKIFNYNYYSG